MTSILNDISSNTTNTNTNTERNTNKYTLEYLTNPQYQKNNTKTKTDDFELNKEQCSFYRKRIIAVTKEMIKGEYASSLYHLEKIHKEYIQSLINHFKRVDEMELIQNEYKDFTNATVSSVDMDMVMDISGQQQKINNEIMMKRSKPVSIDSFITKKVIQIKKDIPIPKKRVLNVNTPAHKVKGIPPKQLKDKV